MRECPSGNQGLAGFHVFRQQEWEIPSDGRPDRFFSILLAKLAPGKCVQEEVYYVCNC